MKNFYITTAIDYANGSPHLGHAYEKILADVIARTKRLNGVPTHLVTGLDEHGQKVQQGADAEGIEPQQGVIGLRTNSKCLSSWIFLMTTIRTAEDRHKGGFELLQICLIQVIFTRQSTRDFTRPGRTISSGKGYG